MKIVVYGLPCAGKTTLMKSIKGAKIIHGSQELMRISGGSFQELSEDEKKAVRIKYTEYINSLEDQVVVSDGHYCFLENVVFTEEDARTYDIYMYLYCKPEILSERFKGSGKNNRYASLSVELIKEWQLFEISSLREACHKNGKEFYVISDCEEKEMVQRIVNESSDEHINLCAVNAFIEYLKTGWRAYDMAVDICERIRQKYPISEEIYLVDGDKTLIYEDSFRYCCEVSTKVFDGDFYTGYQAFLYSQEIEKDILSSKELVDNARLRTSKLRINETVAKEISGKDYVVLSSGLSILWENISTQKSLNLVFSSPYICADTKYYVAKILRQSGYKVTAYGDSKIDLYMLREADEGVLCIGSKISRSLEKEKLSGLRLLHYDSKLSENIAVCKSDSGINGSRLAKAHVELGIVMGERLGNMIPEEGTAILELERGGRFFGDGVYMGFGGTFHTMNPSKDDIPEVVEDRIVIVDSVINTGKSVLKLIDRLKDKNPFADIYIACNVIQEKALKLFEADKIFYMRVSKNYFVGVNQAEQTGEKGPDTAERLYNLIQRRG